MSSRRPEIRMTEDESFSFLSEQRFGVLGTLGRSGVPHMVNVGYLITHRRVLFTSFAAAQKIKNLERTGQASLLVEVTWPYREIRGVLLSGPATIVRDTDQVIEVTNQMKREHARLGAADEDMPKIDIAKHAPRRVAVYLDAERIASWDHRRLGNVY
jgi:nitroimidazol reductase NimA-like FMN-containing flavoprotein (pyridoxamine 5'-phosphate oxidase superfamily)